MRAFAVAVMLLATACSGAHTDGSWVQLSWTFADGRTCLDTDAAYVEVTSGNDSADWGAFLCEHGLAPASEDLAGLRATGEKIVVTAYSFSHAPLYAGELVLGALPTAVTVTLFATN